VGDLNAIRPVRSEDGDGGLVGQAEPSLSLVIPAYNEAARIEATVLAVAGWMGGVSYPVELIVVDDGSDDATADLAEQALHAVPGGRLIRLPHGGKATAVRAGMFGARGEQVAFSDADLATPLSYLGELRSAVNLGCDIAIGSREGAGARRIGEPIYRHLMGRVFNTLVRVLLVPGINDTQCGFKLFRAEVARDLLERSRLYRDASRGITGPRVTAFDVELLTIARYRGYRVCSVPVVWSYGRGSKVRPARDTWHNARDVLAVWISARRGWYEESSSGRRES
jgi:glycosyltransferase involved in cell wall biosynthesis